MKKVKFTALLLVLILLFCSLCSCKSEKPGGGTKDETVVLKCNGTNITRDTYNYFYNNYKEGDSSLSDQELYNLSVDAIKRNVALEELAKEWNVELTEDDEKKLDEYIQNTIDTESQSEGSIEGYYKFLDESNLTEELFRHLYELRMLEDKLREYAYAEQSNIIKSDDATLDEDIKNNFYSAKQILIITDSGENDEENKALAENILQRIKSGEDFDALAEEYNEDQSVNPSYEYVFTDGQMLEEFENAVKSVKEGELFSEVVTSPAGYHIIMRLPLSKETINKRYEDLRYYYKARKFNEMLDEKTNSLSVTKTDKFGQ